MKLPRDLYGTDLARCLCPQLGYRGVHQECSHLILQAESRSHRISVPQHSSLRLGTLNKILSAVARSRGVTKGDILAKL